MASVQNILFHDIIIRESYFSRINQTNTTMCVCLSVFFFPLYEIDLQLYICDFFDGASWRSTATLNSAIYVCQKSTKYIRVTETHTNKMYMCILQRMFECGHWAIHFKCIVIDIYHYCLCVCVTALAACLKRIRKYLFSIEKQIQFEMKESFEKNGGNINTSLLLTNGISFCVQSLINLLCFALFESLRKRNFLDLD